LTRIGQEKKMAVINTNVKALFSQMALSQSGRSQTVAMQQLSTGKRINSARDDAAGMAIATRMTHQIRSLNQAVRNAGDAINLIQTAEGATNQITDMLQRMRELAVQAVNDTNDNAQRSYLDLEFQQLKQQMVQIADQTEWNGFPVLTGEAGQRVGEMPVYKATSIAQFGEVFIDPTTERNVTGKESGQTQEIDLTSIQADVAALAATASATYTLNINDVTFAVTVQGHSTSAQVQSQFINSLKGNAKFANMTTNLSAEGANKLSLTFTAKQLEPDPISVRNATALPTDPDDATGDITSYSIKESQETWVPSDGKFLQSGALNIVSVTKLSDGAATPTYSYPVVANFVNNKNETIPLTGTWNVADKTLSFVVADGRNSEVMSANLTYSLTDSTDELVDLSARKVSLAVSVQGGIPAMNDGDMVINGVPIGASYAVDDKLSPPDNAAGSAIAKAAAINRKAVDSGITTGEVQTLTLTGSPDLNNLPTNITVGGVSITLSTADKTPVLAAATIASALKASPLYDQSTGRTISYQPGSAVITVNYSANEGDVTNIAFDPRLSGLTGQARTTTEAYTSVPGTGVFAKVNENVVTGQAMTGTSVVKGAVFINGFASADITSVFNNPRDTRANVVRAINMISDKTGVKAVDTGSDTQGVTLVAADGRNVEIRFETQDPDFGARVGLREGVQASTISLESKIQAPVVITSSLNIENTGFIKGDFTKNESVFNTAPRAPVTASLAQTETVKVGFPTGDTTASPTDAVSYSVTIAGTQFTVNGSNHTAWTQQDIRNELVTAINTKSNQLGVTASLGDSLDTMVITANVPGIPFDITADKPDGAAMTVKHVVPNTPAPVKPLSPNDLVINGIKIRATTPADDLLSSKVSTSSEPTASAIAVANAINSQSADTGVRAYANAVISDGTYTDIQSPVVAAQYSLYVNGTEVSVYLDKNDTLETRLNNVMREINKRTGEHGVTATVNDQNALSLSSDGRNMSVWFDSSKEGLSAASFGLDKGGAVAQETTLSFSATTAAAGETVSFKLNGVDISVTGPGTQSIAKDIQDEIDASGIANLKVEETSPGSGVLSLKSTVPGSGFTVSGVKVTGSAATTTKFDIKTIQANDMGKNDVTGIYNADELSSTAKTLYGTVRLVSDPVLLPAGVPSPEGAPPSDQLLKLKATGKPFTVTTGIDGLGEKSNFSALGFQVGSYGGQSSAAMDPPRVGRMSFQVGASANQVVTIDLADFGKNGPITSEITGDVDLNVESRTARINTGEGATAVLAKLDLVMDRVNATRATMGAVMNRLDHVISNLTNVSMNLSESRSHIEDADYAAASTELAKTQIMQQAATAVLAQANTSQQSVLKLLGG
jgi:flagellin